MKRDLFYHILDTMACSASFLNPCKQQETTTGSDGQMFIDWCRRMAGYTLFVNTGR